MPVRRPPAKRKTARGALGSGDERGTVTKANRGGSIGAKRLHSGDSGKPHFFMFRPDAKLDPTQVVDLRADTKSERALIDRYGPTKVRRPKSRTTVARRPS